MPHALAQADLWALPLGRRRAKEAGQVCPIRWKIPVPGNDATASWPNPPNSRRPPDRIRSSRRKKLGKRTDSGDHKLEFHSTWGMLANAPHLGNDDEKPYDE